MFWLAGLCPGNLQPDQQNLDIKPGRELPLANDCRQPPGTTLHTRSKRLPESCIGAGSCEQQHPHSSCPGSGLRSGSPRSRRARPAHNPPLAHPQTCNLCRIDAGTAEQASAVRSCIGSCCKHVGTEIGWLDMIAWVNLGVGRRCMSQGKHL
jgi:hypothetical protein